MNPRYNINNNDNNNNNNNNIIENKGKKAIYM